MPSIGFADSKVIKVAVLDNIGDSSLPSDYRSSYLQGVATAVMAAEQQGYAIQYKTFFYSDKPLAIFNEIPQVTAWKPDVIIGPHFSNQFLLLKNRFSNILVISPYASDPELATMSSNFYSLSISDAELNNAIVEYMSKSFPNKNVFNVVAADCKDCIDSSNFLSNLYVQENPAAKVTNGLYVGDVAAVDIGKLMGNYQKDDIIVLQSDSFLSSQQLIFRISSYLARDNLIFINCLDNWGSINSAIMPNKNYTEYWITPYLFDKTSKNYQDFLQYYMEAYKSPPQNAISYTAFLTLISVTTALSNAHYDPSQSMRANILKSYQAAREKNPNWFRPTATAVYRTNAQGVQLIGMVSTVK
jgi:ABC-type branched-subunit amino acid transport system substrate-binding protein